MKYKELINFDPIESVIQLTSSNDRNEAVNLVKSYVMSDNMAEQLEKNMLSQLSLDDVVDNKGVLLVGNYGTGKSHLMSVISAVASDAENLSHLRNQEFAGKAKQIAGRFEVLRIEIGAVTMPLREIILSKARADFAARGLTYDYPDAASVVNNKETLMKMMSLFAEKYQGKGYLIVVDEFLDFLGGKKEHDVRLDLGFMRELGEFVKDSRLRVIFGVQEKLYDNPRFSFVSQTLSRVKDRFEQVVIRKEDTAFVVSERILKKTDAQKALIREHLQKFCPLYSNMSERIEEYVSLFPIHPSYIDVFNKIYIIENRHILKNISTIIGGILESEMSDETPGILSFDSYWQFIRDNFSYRTDADIKEVVEKSGQLMDIIIRSFPKAKYKPLAVKIIDALSVHRLTTGDISIRAGLTSENLRDDLCLFIEGLPDNSSDTLRSIVQVVLKDIMTTVSGQFIERDDDNGQYYLDLKKDVDYDEKITQRAALMSDDSLNRYFYDLVYYCLEWDAKEYVPNFKIYEHTLNWDSRNFFRRGYLFLGTPESRPTAQPPEDYYIYFVPPYGEIQYTDEKKTDEIFFLFKPNEPDEKFKNDLKLYAAAQDMRELAEEKNKSAYQSKADASRKRLTKWLTDNRNTCFDVVYMGMKKTPLEVMKGRYKADNPFKETADLVASLCLDGYFCEKYPEFPVFKTKITMSNQREAMRAGIERFAGRKNALATAMLDSFGLLQGENISTQGSKYAAYYTAQLDKLESGAVLNFNDIYEPSFDRFIDKKFGVSYAILPIVFLGLVYTGHAVITLKNGVVLTASNLDILPKLHILDLYEFKTLSKPKGLPVAELVRLFESLGLPPGQIKAPESRETGLASLIAKAQETVSFAVKAKNKLENDFSLWGEPLLSQTATNQYKDEAKRVQDMLSNFGIRFNTVAKLNNFTYTIGDIEKLAASVAAVNVVLEYDAFRTECSENVSYMTSIEPLSLPDTIKRKLAEAKDAYRKIRDGIAEGKYGEAAAKEVGGILAEVKTAYADYYFEEHKKRRLDVKGAKRKGDIVSSTALSNLKRLKSLDILGASKLEQIEKDLSVLKVCCELTPEMLKTSRFCPKCGFQLDSGDPLVKGTLEKIDDRIDALTEEWTKTLLATVSDPLVASGKEYLKKGQQKAIDDFTHDGKLPENVDNFFITAMSDILKGFDPVPVEASDLAEKLASFGPCDIDTFKEKMDGLLNDYTKDKDKSKLRIIIR